MLGSLVEDFSILTNVQVVVPLASRIDWKPPSNISVIQSSLASSPFDSLSHYLERIDAALIIAPELGGIQQRLTLQLETTKVRNLGSSLDGIHLAADKLQSFQRLSECSIPTIPTWKLSEHGDINSEKWDHWRTNLGNKPLLVKPRFGAGSQEMFVFRQFPSIADLKRLIDSSHWLSDAIIQPYVPSLPLSVAVWCAGNDRDYFPLPTAEQLLADQNKFEYQGGRFPPRHPAFTPQREAELQSSAVAACRAIPGLKGYVGVDLILPHEENLQPLVCEINPRLTTSYLGYRTISRSNLASQWLNFSPNDFGFRKDSLRFSCDGTIELLN